MFAWFDLVPQKHISQLMSQLSQAEIGMGNKSEAKSVLIKRGTHILEFKLEAVRLVKGRPFSSYLMTGLKPQGPSDSGSVVPPSLEKPSAPLPS